jgi:hypothetical protein
LFVWKLRAIGRYKSTELHLISDLRLRHGLGASFQELNDVQLVLQATEKIRLRGNEIKVNPEFFHSRVGEA